MASHCTHNTCNNIYQQLGKRPGSNVGIGIMILNNYNNSKWVCLLGMERAGNYANQFNMIGGSINASDNYCFLAGLKREIYEEAKISLSWQELDLHFKKNGLFNFFIHHGTPIFIGIFQGLSRSSLNPIIAKDNSNQLLDHAKRELYCVDWFNLDCTQMEHRLSVTVSFQRQSLNFSIKMSSYAAAVIKKIDITKL